MAGVTLHLRDRRLDCEGLDADEPSRDLHDKDFRAFARWVATYRDILHRHSEPSALLTLGRELYAWLDGDAGWLECFKGNYAAPLMVEFAVPQPSSR